MEHERAFEGREKGGRFWRTLEEGQEAPDARSAVWNEFPEGASDPPELPADALSRRRFLALLSASAALAAASACSRPDRGTIVPYTEQPEGVVPGLPAFYASCFSEAFDAYPVLVKTREGRPIHVQGNDRYGRAPGKAPYRAVAEVLGLYDPDRARRPLLRGREVPAREAEMHLLSLARKAAGQGRPVLLFTDAVLSPTRARLLDEVRKALPGLEVVSFEAGRGGAAGKVARALFGGAVRLQPRLEKAEAVLSLEADLLSGEDPAAVLSFSAGRRPATPGEPMVRLYAAEGRFTLTGSRADVRFSVRTGDLGAFALGLLRLLVEKYGLPLPEGAGGLSWPERPVAELLGPGAAAGEVEALAKDLASRRGRVLVVAGEHLPESAHAAAALLNLVLDAFGKTLAAEPWPTSYEPAGREKAEEALRRAAEGAYGLVVFWGGNPAHAFPGHPAFGRAGREEFVRIGLHGDETAEAASLLLPEGHWLEAWGDFALPGGVRALRQPALRPLYNDAPQGEEWLLRLCCGLAGRAPVSYADYLKERWRLEEWPEDSAVPFERYWAAALHEGLVPAPPARPPAPSAAALLPFLKTTADGSGAELVLFPSPALYDGRYANNGWLQEWPDPVTKATWGNPLLLSPADARRLGLRDGDLVRLTVGGRSLEGPVLVQPGQREGLFALALGYGRGALSVARGVGTNGFLFVGPGGEMVRGGAAVEKIPGRRPVPTTQTHHRMEGRDLVRCWTPSEWTEKEGEKEHGHPPASLYPDQLFPDYKWGMVIDLSACVGCSGCLLACQSENNVPVVGPEQVLKGREMHWIRVDRYYEGSEEAPRAVHSPMLCQHCDNAPCENVCPVNATNHSPDGLNQMAYNRCVGTRYCANNCPYKVRRFNFLEWTAFKKEPESLVFNPEVSVRPRGVMEKCTFCVQRIEEAKVKAGVEGRKVADGEIVPACAAACPAEAIVFGNLKDPESRVSRLAGSGRAYKVLEELGVRPAVTYLAALRNPPGEGKP